MLVNFKGKPAECEPLHHFECPCCFGLRYKNDLKKYFKIMKEWNKKVVEVANRDEFHDRKVSLLISKLYVDSIFVVSGFYNKYSTFCQRSCLPHAQEWKHRLFLHVIRLLSLVAKRLRDRFQCSLEQYA